MINLTFSVLSLVVSVDIDLPVNGEYALEIYANDPARDGNTYTHVCQYLLVRPNKGDNSAALFYQTPQYNDCYNVHGMQEPLQPVSMSLEQLARGQCRNMPVVLHENRLKCSDDWLLDAKSQI